MVHPLPKAFDHAGSYVQSIHRLVPGHALLVQASVARLTVMRPAPAVVGVVGPGPGDELVALARALPHARFEVYEPSPSMHAACRRRVEEEGLADQVELYQRPVDRWEEPGWDAGVCLLVAHLLQSDERHELARSLASRLRPGAVLVHAEVVCMPPLVRAAWVAWSRERGVSEERLVALRERLSGAFPLWPEATVRALFREMGLTAEAALLRCFGTTMWSLRRHP